MLKNQGRTVYSDRVFRVAVLECNHQGKSSKTERQENSPYEIATSQFPHRIASRGCVRWFCRYSEHEPSAAEPHADSAASSKIKKRLARSGSEAGIVPCLYFS